LVFDLGLIIPDFVSGPDYLVSQLAGEVAIFRRYIVVTKVVNGDPPQYEYKWGPRAYHETTKRKVLEFVTQVCCLNVCFYKNF